jgi:hypothetical protein
MGNDPTVGGLARAATRARPFLTERVAFYRIELIQGWVERKRNPSISGGATMGFAALNPSDSTSFCRHTLGYTKKQDDNQKGLSLRGVQRRSNLEATSSGWPAA